MNERSTHLAFAVTIIFAHAYVSLRRLNRLPCIRVFQPARQCPCAGIKSENLPKFCFHFRYPTIFGRECRGLSSMILPLQCFKSTDFTYSAQETPDIAADMFQI